MVLIIVIHAVYKKNHSNAMLMKILFICLSSIVIFVKIIIKMSNYHLTRSLKRSIINVEL